MTTVWPITSLMRCPSTLVTTSTMPPGGTGTTMRTVFTGKSLVGVCPPATPPATAQPTPQTAANAASSFTAGMGWGRFLILIQLPVTDHRSPITGHRSLLLKGDEVIVLQQL